MSRVTLDVSGMSCENCVKHVTKALKKVVGVTEASVDLSGKRASVEFDEATTNVDALVAAVTKAGYPASPHA
jgi:mercuric transport protein